METIRTIPTKKQVLEAAKMCPQTKDALKILFPEDFKKKFDKRDVKKNPANYIRIGGSKENYDEDLLLIHPDLAEAIDFTGNGSYEEYNKWIGFHMDLKGMIKTLQKIQDYIEN